jgi:hypothetical protein
LFVVAIRSGAFMFVGISLILLEFDAAIRALILKKGAITLSVAFYRKAVIAFV